MLGNTWRLPLVCTGPSPGSIVTDVASLTDQRRVADCPRSIELGSAVNCAMTGAFAGAGGGVVTTGGGAGGGGAAATGAFFLHPAANITSKTLIKIVALFRLLNSVCPPNLNSYLPQIGISFLPCVVSCWMCVEIAHAEVWTATRLNRSGVNRPVGSRRSGMTYADGKQGNDHKQCHSVHRSLPVV